MAAEFEVYTAIQAADLIRAKHPDIKLQVSVVSYLNLITSNDSQHCSLMNRLAPSGVPLLRLAGLSPDALGVSRGTKEFTCGTQYLTQSCSKDELSSDQGYDLASVIKAIEQLLEL